MDTAAWYVSFAENEAKGSSPRYERLATEVSSDAQFLSLLDGLPVRKRQPNLLFASVQFLEGPTANWRAFREFVFARWEELSKLMLSRSTQTNEPARCGALIPALSSIEQPIALIEVGASAGLCLFPDRYSYSYHGQVLGSSELLIEVEVEGPVPIPTEFPEISWRRGIDLRPLDITDGDDMAWLQACIWPEHDHRRERLRLAATIVANDPPVLIRGDLNEQIEQVLATAPPDLTKVVFHSAVMNYLNTADRRRFTSLMMSRSDVVWISNEAPGVVSDLVSQMQPPSPGSFLLGRNGTSALGYADPHGSWLHWISSD